MDPKGEDVEPPKKIKRISWITVVLAKFISSTSKVQDVSDCLDYAHCRSRNGGGSSPWKLVYAQLIVPTGPSGTRRDVPYGLETRLGTTMEQSDSGNGKPYCFQGPDAHIGPRIPALLDHSGSTGPTLLAEEKKKPDEGEDTAQACFDILEKCDIGRPSDSNSRKRAPAVQSGNGSSSVPSGFDYDIIGASGAMSDGGHSIQPGIMGIKD